LAKAQKAALWLKEVEEDESMKFESTMKAAGSIRRKDPFN
jgi:hypothetical protein